MLLVITSSRTLDDRPYLLDWAIKSDGGRPLWESCDGLVCGYGSEIDKTAAEWATEEGIEVLPFKVSEEDWARLGKKAGPLRNTEMVRVSDLALAVWDGVSRGTYDTIKKAVSSGLTTYVFYCYHSKAWPIDPVVWLKQQKETKAHHDLAGGRWVTNYFSNFFAFEEPLIIDGISYEYPENAYQAMKSRDPQYREKIASLTPGQAKSLSRKVGSVYSQRADWHQVKFRIMFNIQKHRAETGPMFSEWLEGTRGTPIIEWSNWGDKYWGMDIDTGEGENWMGRILMMLRDYKLV